MHINLLNAGLSELHALHFALYQANRGFYRNHGWLLVEETTEKKPIPDVIMPNIDFSEYISVHKKDLDVYSAERRVFKLEESKLASLKDYIEKRGINLSSTRDGAGLPNINRVRFFLTKVEKKIKRLFPEFNRYEFVAVIGESKYGTYGSHSVVCLKTPDKNPIRVEMRIRTGEPLETLGELFVSALLKSRLKGSWENQEAVVDYVLKEFLRYDSLGTLERFENTTPDLIKRSLDYSLRIGVPSTELLTICEENKKITCLGKQINHYLSPYEHELLALLIKKRYETATFDEIAREIYKTDCDRRFTFWGITKNVQRLRKKLTEVGLPKNAIQNVRGVGFKLVA